MRFLHDTGFSRDDPIQGDELPTAFVGDADQFDDITTLTLKRG